MQEIYFIGTELRAARLKSCSGDQCAIIDAKHAFIGCAQIMYILKCKEAEGRTQQQMDTALQPRAQQAVNSTMKLTLLPCFSMFCLCQCLLNPETKNIFHCTKVQMRPSVALKDKAGCWVSLTHN